MSDNDKRAQTRADLLNLVAVELQVMRQDAGDHRAAGRLRDMRLAAFDTKQVPTPEEQTPGSLRGTPPFAYRAGGQGRIYTFNSNGGTTGWTDDEARRLRDDLTALLRADYAGLAGARKWGLLRAFEIALSRAEAGDQPKEFAVRLREMAEDLKAEAHRQ